MCVLEIVCSGSEMGPFGRYGTRVMTASLLVCKHRTPAMKGNSVINLFDSVR